MSPVLQWGGRRVAKEEIDMRTKLFLIVLAALFATSTAMAEGFYAGAGLGIVKIEDSDQGESFDDSPMGWRIHGGYDFNENFAVEGSYIQTGDAEDVILGENVEVQLSAFTFSVLGLLPMSDDVELFGKLGFYTGEQEITVQGITFDEDDDGLTVGAGVRFNMSDTFALRGDFDWFDTDIDTVWSLGIGFNYRFGN